MTQDLADVSAGDIIGRVENSARRDGIDDSRFAPAYSRRVWLTGTTSSCQTTVRVSAW